MSRFVRPSSYRHVYGQPSKVSYENAKISGSAWDTNLITAGGKYIALNWQVSGGGAFAILPSFSPWDIPEAESFPTKLPDLLPLARGHSAPVLDTAWSPFDDNLVVSGGEDGKIFLWKVEDDLFNGWGKDGWEPEDLAPIGKLNAGGRKVGHVEFHPVAANLLTSASGDHLVRVWDIEADDVAITLTGHTDSIQSIAWNATGTTLATTCRDRKLRLFDPRAGTEAVRVADGHSGIKGSRVVWLGDRDRIATTGFSKMSDRQLGLWDTSSLTNLKMDSLDSSAGIIVPFFADGNDVLFLAGKGDGNIRYYEFEGDNFHFLNEYKTSTPQRGIGFIPRRGLDVSQNEIARAFKLSGREVTPLSFIVPRKAEGFQSDIYPPANSIEPAMTAKDWLGGKNARPNVIDLETRTTSANKAPISTPKASTPAASTPAPSTPKEEPKVEPKKEEPKAEPKVESKVEPKVEPKAEPRDEPKATPPPKDDVKAKDLEIEQPDSEDEDKSKTSLAAAGAGAGALAGAGAVAAAGGASTAKSTPAASTAKSTPAASSPATPSVPSTPAAETNGSGAANNSDELLIKLLSDKATLPTRGSSHAAGHDLYAAADTTVPARGQALVETGISVAVPTGTYGRVAPRSGLAVKHAIDTGAGVIDADYRGEVKVVLFNHSDKDFKIARGDRIAQLILERVHMAPLRQVDDLEATVRGSGGFGSTGGFRH